MNARHFKVTGIVQGVFFRANTVEQAERLGLTGWVKNCEDGSVEAQAEGSDDTLDELEQWMQTGPPGAQVEDVKVTKVEPEGFDSFELKM